MPSLSQSSPQSETWTAREWSPPPLDENRPAIDIWAARYGVDPDLVAKVAAYLADYADEDSSAPWGACEAAAILTASVVSALAPRS
jgi:hypothetical protein